MTSDLAGDPRITATQGNDTCTHNTVLQRVGKIVTNTTARDAVSPQFYFQNPQRDLGRARTLW